MTRKFWLFLSLVIVSLWFTPGAHAGWLQVDSTGQLHWSREEVLSRNSADESEDQAEDGNTSGSSTDSQGTNDNQDEDGNKVNVESLMQGNRVQTEVFTGGRQIRVEVKDGELKVNDEDEDELEFEEEEGSESAELTEVEIEEHANSNKIKIKARGDFLEIKVRGIGALTHFPLTIGPNNELIVTTPAGTKVVTVLPAVAAANILESNIMDRILAYRAAQASASATPVASSSAIPEATSSASPVETPEEVTLEPSTIVSASPLPETEEIEDIELTVVDGHLTYKIKGEKEVKLLGVFRFSAPVSAEVSAETGEVVRVDRPFFLSFFPFLFTD